MDPIPKRVKMGDVSDTDEDGAMEMETDGVHQGTAVIEGGTSGGALPHAPDPETFLENPCAFDAGSPCLSGTIDNENNTALICAVKAGSESAFFKLLDGKDSGYVNFQNSKGVTALNIASHRGQLEIVRALLEKAKADVNIPNTSGSTSLIQASHFGHTAVVQLLLQHRAIVDRPNHKGTTALMRAAQEGHIGVVEALVCGGADVNKRNNERMNALMLASQRGHDAIVKLLIRHGADIDCQTVQGSTALMLACKRQHEDVVQVLLTAGAEMFITDSRGRTARDTANKRGNKDIISMLHTRRQVRLMQSEARVERSHVMARLYDLQSQKRCSPVTGVRQSHPIDNSLQVLYRAFDLPFSLFQTVVRFIPWPRMWETLLPMLHRRCNIDANEAIRGALGIMDEVLTDLLISPEALQEMHLIRASRSPEIADVLRTRYKMPVDIVDSVRWWGDVQSVLAKFERGVVFTSAIAEKAVKDAARLYNWYKLGAAEDTHSSSSSSSLGMLAGAAAVGQGAEEPLGLGDTMVGAGGNNHVYAGMQPNGQNHLQQQLGGGGVAMPGNPNHANNSDPIMAQYPPLFPPAQHMHHGAAIINHGYHDAADYGMDDGSSDGDLE